MKRIISFVWPFLLLFLALGFMSQYKQLDELSDAERYEVKTFVDAAEARDSNDNEDSEDDREDGDKQSESVASSNGEQSIEENKDPNKSYAVTSDDQMVTVYDDDGTPVFETTTIDWEEHREDYYEKYQLGMK